MAGQEVACYAKKHFTEILKKRKSFNEKKYDQALKDTFIEIDERLKTAEGKTELAEISASLKKQSSPLGKVEG